MPIWNRGQHGLGDTVSKWRQSPIMGDEWSLYLYVILIIQCVLSFSLTRSRVGQEIQIRLSGIKIARHNDDERKTGT